MNTRVLTVLGTANRDGEADFVETAAVLALALVLSTRAVRKVPMELDLDQDENATVDAVLSAIIELNATPLAAVAVA